MGELTASLAHEVNQPIAAAVTNANTCLRWLTRDHPIWKRRARLAMRIVKDGTRAAEIISRIACSLEGYAGLGVGGHKRSHFER